MSKLIFNPEKDMKKLEKYGLFDIEKANSMCSYYSSNEHDLSGIRIGKHNRKVRATDLTDAELVILYKLIKANLIIDEEELKNGIVD